MNRPHEETPTPARSAPRKSSSPPASLLPRTLRPLRRRCHRSPQQTSQASVRARGELQRPLRPVSSFGRAKTQATTRLCRPPHRSLYLRNPALCQDLARSRSAGPPVSRTYSGAAVSSSRARPPQGQTGHARSPLPARRNVPEVNPRARPESYPRGTSLFGRTPSSRRFACPRFAGHRIAESDPRAAFGARPPRHRRPKVPSRGGVGAPHYARRSACRASRVRSSTDGTKHIHRLRTPRRLSVPAASLEAPISPPPLNLAVTRKPVQINGNQRQSRSPEVGVAVIHSVANDLEPVS